VRAWKDFLWPLLVLPDPSLQPLSVALARLQNTELSLMMAGMFISVVIPVALFLAFQKQFLRGAGQAGALKG
jgi:multiple sugar transport system permease protein